MKHLLYIASFFLLVLFSCNSGGKKDLDAAESLLQQRPDSALAILSAINPEALSSKKESARYALLMSAALDKNRIDVGSDTLISKAVEYYTRHNDLRHRMLAHYYHGVILKNGKSYPAAIVSLEKADAIASTLNDSYHLGLINRNKANVFTSTNNTQEAIVCMQKAVSYFDEADAQSYKAYAELSLAIDYLNSLDYEKSDSLFSYIQKEYDDPNLMHYCNLNRASILAVNGNNPKDALQLFQKVPQRYFSILDYADYALAYEKAGNRDSADFWLARGYSLCRTRADSAALDYSKSKMALRRGDFERAYYLMSHATTIQDSVTRVLLNQSISNSQRDYYKSEALLQTERMKTVKRQVFLFCIIGVLAFLLVVFCLVGITRKKEHNLKDQIAQLLLNKNETERIKKENAHLLGSLFSSRLDNLDALAERYYQIEKEDEREVVFKDIKQNIEFLRKDPNVFLALEYDLDRYCNGIMSKLRAQVPKLKEDNLKLISLFFAGVPDSAIKLLMNKVSSDSLRMAKSRLRKEILNSNAPDKELFLDMLKSTR